MTNSIIKLKKGSLHCYSNTTKDFVDFIKKDISKQLDDYNFRYSGKLPILGKIDEIIKLNNEESDFFVKNYFNDNRNIKILNNREKIINSIIERNKFLSYLKKYIKINFTKISVKKDFLNKDEFQVEVVPLKLGESYFLINEKLTNLYILGKITDRKIYLYFREGEELELENISYEIQRLQKLNMEDKNTYCFDKIINVDSDLKMSFQEDPEYMKKKILGYINDEIFRKIIQNNEFKKYLKTFYSRKSN